MNRFTTFTLAALLSLIVPAIAQTNSASTMADLIALKSKISNPDTRTRVDAFHRAWVIASSSSDPAIKLAALQLMAEPVNSSSDHIRIPAVYAIADIANSTDDPQIKLRAIELLTPPLVAGQVPIRDVVIDAINSITAFDISGDATLAAVKALGEPVRSGNNGVRIPAINALVRTVNETHNEAAFNAALDLLSAPLDSMAMIGGMEVRLMAVVAVERIGIQATSPAGKAKAMGMLRACVSKASWEPEAKRRAEEASANIQNSITKPPARHPKPTVNSLAPVA